MKMIDFAVQKILLSSFVTERPKNRYEQGKRNALRMNRNTDLIYEY